MERLTKNFWIAEFEHSDTAANLGLRNVMDAQAKARATELCTTLMEPIRSMFGNAPIILTSGYRAPHVNIHVPGASATSQHQFGEACDWRFTYGSGIDLLGAAERIAASDLPYHQLIYYGNRCHISIAPVGQRPRRQTLTWTGTGYLDGLSPVPA